MVLVVNNLLASVGELRFEFDPEPEDPLEEGMAASSILARRIHMVLGTWWAAVHKTAESQTQLKRFSMHACVAS